MTMVDVGQRRLDVARSTMLDPNGLDLDALARTLEMLRGNGTDYADLYFETTTVEMWRIEDQRVTSSSYAVRQGVGVRTQTGARATLAYTSDLGRESLATAADSARRMQQGGDVLQAAVGPVSFRDSGEAHDLYGIDNVVEGQDAAARIALLRDIDGRARAVDPRIVKVVASLRLTETVILVAATDGTLSADTRPMMQLHLTIIAEAGAKRAQGRAGAGGRYGLVDLEERVLRKLIERATNMALVNLDARPAPADTMSVVLAPGFPGVLLHEAVGHGLEGDAHRKHSSIFAQRTGETIAAPGVSVVDDGTIPGLIGSANVDDEGTKTERTVLIENGRLVGLMQDRTNARLMNQRSTGNGRRQSYAHLPMPRMTNTFLAPGNEAPEDIIRSVRNGIYAAEIGGGTVDITSGRFNFSATLAYLIEDGRITAPISGATLIGIGDEALKHVSMVGHDLGLDDGEAVCGKEGQSVLVGVGQPTIRIDGMVVGGQA